MINLANLLMYNNNMSYATATFPAVVTTGGNFKSVAMLSDGSKAIAGGGADNNLGLWHSDASISTWSQSTNTLGRFNSVAISTDGLKAIAGSGSGLGILYSDAPFLSWTRATNSSTGQPLSGNFNSVAISDDGLKAIAGSNNSTGIWYSTFAPNSNFLTWTQSTSAATSSFNSVAISSDGSKAIAGSTSVGIWYSSDAGITWTQSTSAATSSFNSVAISSDGSKAIAGSNSVGIWYSTFAPNSNFLTWTQSTSAATSSFNSVAISSDGSNTIAGSSSNTGIWYSTDAGVTWNQYITSSQQCRSIAINSAGSKAIAGSGIGTGIWYSDNPFSTWAQATNSGDTLPLTGSFFSVAISDNGSNAIAGNASSTNSTGIWYSTSTPLSNFTTWTRATNSGDGLPLTGSFLSVAISSNDNTTAIAGNASSPNSTGIWYSSDAGVTWTQATNSGDGLPLTGIFRSVAISSDGLKAIAGSNSTGIWYSTFAPNSNFLTWTQSTSAATSSFNSVAISSDGSMAIAGSTSGTGIWYSTDAGVTWTRATNSVTVTPLAGTFFSVAISSDGSTAIAASVSGTGIWYSIDGGVTWTPTSIATGVFATVAISSDGTIAVAGNYGENTGIWYSTVSPFSSWTQATSSAIAIFSVAISSNLYSIAASGNTGLFYTPTALCLNNDTKILCFTVDGEKYVPIQDLREGDLVKSYLHGYRKIKCIGKNSMINKPSIWNQSMWKMEKTDTNDLIEDLIMLGGHSLLVDTLSDEMKEIYKEKWHEGLVSTIDGKVLLIAGLSGLFTQLEDTGIYTYYQLTLDNEGDLDKRFGIWANGVLVETPSETQFNLGKWRPLDKEEKHRTKKEKNPQGKKEEKHRTKKDDNHRSKKDEKHRIKKEEKQQRREEEKRTLSKSKKEEKLRKRGEELREWKGMIHH